ncbi:MAG: hypothetical protein BAJATHORv1_40242 [Candidatus Thorarchaeota archaeon]|nr:MAG: hypothetical protein BAJATHORv1_40242 [Candidatus Thorarchaeota archaeon]
MRVKNLIIVWLLISTIAALPILGVSAPFDVDNRISKSSVETLDGVPYVWQELNGYCAWAATSILFQYAGADLDLGGIFAASTVGYSFAYIRYNDTFLMFPGVMYQQVEPTAFAADLYNLNFTLYISGDAEGADEAIEYWDRRGISTGMIEDQVEAMDLMRNTINSGYPLIVSVDPSWIPISDYDDLRENELRGGGHALVIVGYNDTSQTVTFIDPGVGAFGDNYGYPADGRGNYSTMSYSTLNFAWIERYYISYVIKPKDDSNSNTEISPELGPLIRDKLLGVGAIYSPESPSAYLWHYGEDAFRELSKDVTMDGLKDYLSVFDGASNEVLLKAGLLAMIGIGVEVQSTLQGYSFKAATHALPAIMSDVNLTEFIEAAESAYPHFEALSDNSSLLYPTNLTKLTGYVATTFLEMAERYNNTGDLDSILSMYSADLEVISNHLLGIADAWQNAGNVLDTIWPTNIWMNYGSWIVIAAVGIGVLAVVTVIVIKRTPSR